MVEPGAVDLGQVRGEEPRRRRVGADRVPGRDGQARRQLQHLDAVARLENRADDTADLVATRQEVAGLHRADGDRPAHHLDQTVTREAAARSVVQGGHVDRARPDRGLEDRVGAVDQARLRHGEAVEEIVAPIADGCECRCRVELQGRLLEVNALLTGQAATVAQQVIQTPAVEPVLAADCTRQLPLVVRGVLQVGHDGRAEAAVRVADPGLQSTQAREVVRRHAGAVAGGGKVRTETSHDLRVVTVVLGCRRDRSGRGDAVAVGDGRSGADGTGCVERPLAARQDIAHVLAVHADVRGDRREGGGTVVDEDSAGHGAVRDVAVRAVAGDADRLQQLAVKVEPEAEAANNRLRRHRAQAAGQGRLNTAHRQVVGRRLAVREQDDVDVCLGLALGEALRQIQGLAEARPDIRAAARLEVVDRVLGLGDPRRVHLRDRQNRVSRVREADQGQARVRARAGHCRHRVRRVLHDVHAIEQRGLGGGGTARAGTGLAHRAAAVQDGDHEGLQRLHAVTAYEGRRARR